MAKTLPGPWVLITDVFVIIVIAIVIDICCFFFLNTAIVSLGSSDKNDEDIQGGMERKRKECSDQDKAGELN